MVFELTRRELLAAGGVLAAGAVGATTAAPKSPQRTVATLTEGTNISAVPSPDGKLVAFDLVNSIWIGPAQGGEARRLTDDLGEATLPHFSPDGASLVFQSYRDGNYHAWTIGVDGSKLTRLTSGPFDHREPRFAPDGRSIAFSSDRGGGSYGIFRHDLATGAIDTLIDVPAEQAWPAWSADGSRVAYTVDDKAIDVLELATGAVTRVVSTPESTVFGPSFAPDGRLAYVRITGAVAELVVDGAAVTSGEDVFAFRPSWSPGGELLYTADGHIRRLTSPGSSVNVPFTAAVPVPARGAYRRALRDVVPSRERDVLGIASPVASRDGSRIAFRALNALWLLELGSSRPRRIVSDGYFGSDPDFSPDGQSIVYSSDRAGDADLWLRDLVGGTERRLTALPGAQITPRFSPDGSRIAYQDHDGATWVLDVQNGQSTQVTPTLFMPGRPSWSPDGNTLALAAVKPYSKRYREGTSQILTVNLSDGALTYQEPMPHGSIATRGDDGPLWSPDGANLAFVLESTAWVAPVDAVGRLTGPARQVTTEVTDSLAWIGADRLLYLNNGRLRSVSIGTGAVSTIPMSLRRQPAQVTEHTVIRAGGLWDGRSSRLRENVDIVVSRGRVQAVLPAGAGPATVDASGLTVLPGLIDAHNHWHLRGRQWGDRQGRSWLAFGITTTRSPGDPAYQMVETREALDSGARVGPRYFATGEAVDGSRVYYNFMRPTRSVEQLRLELERAEKLGYDLIKTYVRLPVDYQKRVIEAAHRAGLPLSSHYLYPAEHLGMDGMEHTGATNRLGYSHTVSRLGRAYRDVIELFVRSGMSVTPTLFNSAVLYAEDRSLVDDPRTRTLYPSWEYERLVQKADDALLPPAETMRALLKANVDMVLRIHRGGGFVIAGTDSPLDNVAVSLHTNLRAMVKYGFTPLEALTTATRNSARWLGRERELGLVAPGALADLAFVTGNPLADIRAAAAVRMVMVGGTLHTVDDLMVPFAAPSAANAPAVVRHAVAQHRHDDHWWHEPEWSQLVCCGT